MKFDIKIRIKLLTIKELRHFVTTFAAVDLYCHKLQFIVPGDLYRVIQLFYHLKTNISKNSRLLILTDRQHCKSTLGDDDPKYQNKSSHCTAQGRILKR